MLINLKVKTLDAQTHEFSIDNEITIREFKDKIAEKTNIAADQQRIIYCGRVLADEKQVKEYDVDGKVVHVAERPPPSQRGPSTSGSTSNDTPTVRERSANRGGMRSSPLFRALDGMVVGTMAIPMNSVQNNGQPPINPFAASSSFCMNRITVARHMLECANNIAAYLEDPERGLNNTSLDILARGSWTMESTVVEVGITTTDLPQNQNFVEMVQDAVSAALRRNSNTTNVTVVQLPTVFGASEGEGGAIEGAQNVADNMETNASTGEADTGAVIIEDVIDDGEDGIGGVMSGTSENSGSEATNNAASSRNVTMSDTLTDNVNNSTTTGTNTDENPSRRRTNTNVLAEVIDHMRTVQTRLDPFIQQYYDLLRNEPTFEENDTTGRENAQRLYNRVSEAFHYLSHAQHAISDLMLDVSQPAPRYLTCRPILVEQSGYVSSNNYLTAAAAAAGTGNQQRPRTRTYISPRYNHPISITTSPPTTTAAATTATNASGSGGGGSNNVNNANGNSSVSNGNGNANGNGNGNGNGNNIVEDPVDDPVVAPNITIGENATNAAAQNDGNTVEIVLHPRRGLVFGNNPQVQMSRLIQAVVNSAPIDTEFHVQILPPTILSVPVNSGQAQAQSSSRTANNEQQQQAGAASSTNNANNGNNSNNSSTESTTSPNANTPVSLGSSSNQARVNTATLPTTSTQTRSTSRPQLQIGGLPANGWNGRFIPANMMSSFDRFLPCNSHHIREAENSGNNNGGTNGTANTNTSNPQIINTNTVNPRTMRTLAHLMQRVRPSTTTSTVGTNPPTTTQASRRMQQARRVPMPVFDFLEARNLYANGPLLAAAGSSSGLDASNDTYSRNLRTQLVNFMNQSIFEGGPINEETIPTAVNRAVNWFGESLTLLPQYEKPEYDSRDSVINILRGTLPKLIEVVRDNQESPSSFERRLKQICEEFVKRLFSVLHVCVGRSNAELYWGQLMRLLLIPTQTIFRDEALHFLCIYINTDIPSSTDTVDAQQFIVIRQTQNKPSDTFVSPPPAFTPQPMETDVEMAEIASTSEVSIATNQIPADIDEELTAMEEAPEEPLPSVVAGSETWHRNFPNDWLPIITRDLHTQSSNSPSQAPFSDAYISGMSAKRRKLVQNSKPPTDINSLVERSVRKAIQTVGVRSSTASNQSVTADDITEAIASDAAVNSVYTEAVRTNVRERLKKDPDYKSEKYPQTTKFINK